MEVDPQRHRPQEQQSKITPNSQPVLQYTEGESSEIKCDQNRKPMPTL